MAWNTGCNSPGDVLMTLNTSDVAVCRSNDSRSSLSSLVLDGDDGLGGEILHQCNLLVGERSHFLAVNAKNPDKLVFF